MPQRTKGPKCSCTSCVVFHEDWLQCHGDIDPVEDPCNATCTEHINGFDATATWFSDVDDVWQHIGLTSDCKVFEGWVQADVPEEGLSDNPRLYCTSPL